MLQANLVKEKVSEFSSIKEVIEAIRQGESIIVVDDEKRENEGDLICAAEKISPELINFMTLKGRGLICVALEAQRLNSLGLSRLPGNDTRKQTFGTAFAESVDAREGITTGISAADRAHTASMLADPSTTASDLVKPGHLFPLEAHPHGVLGRAGHTEAAVDLARLAGLAPAGVICEILKADGHMARLPDLFTFAKEHSLKICSIEQLITYQQQHKTLIDLERSITLPTEYGDYILRSYTHKLNDLCHLALILGNPCKVKHPLVRLHSECLTGDVFGSLRCDCGSQLRASMEILSGEGQGIILYMRQEGRGIGLGPKLHAYELQDKGLDTVEANKELGFRADQRDYVLSAQILNDIGVNDIRLITNNPQKVEGLKKYGIQVIERVSLKIPTNMHNERYLETKKMKLGHWL